MTITANGTSTYSFTEGSDPLGSNHIISLASFSDSSVFTSLSSLDFTITFPSGGISAPSAAFSGPIVFGPPVPEPSSIVLSMGGLILLGGRRYLSRRRKA